jgi:putative protease
MADLVPAGMSRAGASHVVVALGNLHDLSLLKQEGVDELILPLSPGACAKIKVGGRATSKIRKPTKIQERILWDLPLAIFGEDWSEFQVEVNRLIESGFRRFRLQNISQLSLFDGCEGLSLQSGYRLFTTNSQAACAWRDLGLAAATLYVEDDRDNMAAILNRETGLPLTVTAYANLPMMTSRIPLRGVKSEHPLVSDRDEAYRMDNRAGLTVIRPEQDFSLIGHLGELQQMGCSRFVVDLAHLGPASAEGRHVLAAFAQDETLPGRSSFNYLQEMV